MSALPLSATGPTTVGELVTYVRADRSRHGAVLLHPAVTTALWFRVSQLLWRQGWRPLAKLIEWRLMRTVGCQLAPSAEVGPGLHLPHPVGIVLGGRAHLGAGVTVGQNVTLGAGRSTTEHGDQPFVEDGVKILAGSVVIGGIVIGAGAVIGANAVVREDVPPGRVVAPARSTLLPERPTTPAVSPGEGASTGP